jgi:hypothetical protein
MKIEPLKSYKMKHEAWYSFFREILGIISKRPSAMQLILAYYTKILELVNSADEILQQQRKSALTIDFETASSSLIDQYRALRMIVKALAKDPNPNIASAAKRLYILVKTYEDDILRGSYLERNGAMQNLMQDLDGSSLADVVVANIQNWVATLKSAHEQYWTLHQQRDANNSQKALGNLRAIISKANKMYGMMKSQVNSILSLADMGEDFVDNSLIANYNPDDENPPSSGERKNDDGDSAIAKAKVKIAAKKSAPAENERDYPVNAITAYRLAVALNVVIWKYNTSVAQQAGRRKSRKKKLEAKKKQEKKNNKKPGASS